MARSNRRLTYKKELYYIVCIVGLLVVLLFSFWGPGGYRDLQKARLELQEQRIRVNELKRKNYNRMKSIESLRSDKKALEKYAREKGYGKEGEIIQQLPPEPEEKPDQTK
ncbi:MAG: septum formation initiator family protein [Acidobacteria bacterium]|nr:septum formation initiator family protein [Acidobacteriota bacterium]